MNNNLKYILTGSLTLAIGAIAGYFVAKYRYEKLADEECKSLEEKINELIVNKSSSETKNVAKEEPKKMSPVIDKKSFNNITPEQTYHDYSRIYRENISQAEQENFEKVNEDYTSKYIVLITSTEFVQSPYEIQKTLMYYADGVLADDDYNEIKNIKDYVGDFDLFKLFSEGEEDVVYIRNAYLKQDYEIIFDERNFKDLVGKYRNLNKDEYDNR